MPKTKKVITDLQKQILSIRRETEDKYADKAATEEKINRLSFTLSLYQAEKIMGLKGRITELEAHVRKLPRAIRKLEAKHRKLRSSEQSPH